MNKQSFKQKLLDELYQPYQHCMQCPLGSLGRTNVVFGDGNANADIMFIGEAPGKNEDIQGKPFVGRAGKVLDKALETIHIKRSDTYITNVVKCRPPQNRNPKPIEITTCKNILLYNQIKIIQPKLIITLGAIALKALLGDSIKISQARGHMHTLQDIPLMPTYHPAYILRSPKKYPLLEHDIKTGVKKIIQK